MCTEMSHSNGLESAPLNGYVSTSRRAVSVGPSCFGLLPQPDMHKNVVMFFYSRSFFSNTTVKIQYLNASGSLN